MNRIRRRLDTTLLVLFVVALFVLIMFPLMWLVSTSFKEQRFLIDLPPQWIPNPITLEHNANVLFHEMNFFAFLKNSLIVALGTSL